MNPAETPRPAAPVPAEAETDDDTASARAEADRGTVDLRLLATSDLHMQLLGFDYLTRTAVPTGLEHLAGVIARARAAVPRGNSLLVDNGDLLEGNLLADHVLGRDGPARHPAILCLNTLGYDAAGLGNHDFSLGPAALARALRAARFPVVVANARLPGLAVRLPPWVILRRRVSDRAGTVHDLRIGVAGFIPPLTAAWEAGTVPGLATEDVVDAARRAVAGMRAAGADVVVALVHGGLGEAEHRPESENAALAVAGLPQVDAVIGGHTHELYARPAQDGVAALVMPGCGGSHLGIIDLVLHREAAGGWRVAGGAASCHPAEGGAGAGTAAAAALRRAVLPLHRAALRHAARRVGRTDTPLGSHFAMLGIDAGLRLVAMAQRWQLRQAVRGSRWEGVPILVAAAPFRTGGPGGAGNFTDIPAGRLSRGDLAALYAFGNEPAAVEISGAQLTEWLERAATAFHTIRPGIADQPLLRSSFPGYHFDLIDGLQWTLDLAQPGLFAPDGAASHGPGRVTALRHAGRAVDPAARFVLACTDYRLAGGPYAPLTEGLTRLPFSGPRLREIIAAYLRRHRRVAPPNVATFTLAGVPGASAVLRVGPRAADALPPGLPLTPIGIDEAGFLQLRLDLDRLPRG